MILQHYGKKITREEVDAKIRQIDGPTSPASIVSFAKEQGLNAALYNRGSVDELKKFLDRGIPLEVMIDPDANPNDTVLHYVVVTGYEADPKTGKTNLLINDPARLEPVRMSESDFLEKWSSLKVKNFDSGLDKFFIAIAPKDAEIPGSRMAGGHTASIAFRGIAVGESVGRWGIDTGNAISKAATNAWNTVKGWFGG
ncbi:Peptidase C39 family protein [compost metagenome]